MDSLFVLSPISKSLQPLMQPSCPAAHSWWALTPVCSIHRHLLPSEALAIASPCLPERYISLCGCCLPPSSLLAFEGRGQLPTEQASPSILSWFVCDTQPAVGLSSGEPEDVSLDDNILSLCNCSVGETYWLASLAVRFDLRAKHR